MELTVTDRESSRSFSVAWIEINTPTGNYVVQPGHAPAFFIISPQQPLIFRLKTGKQTAINVRRGIIEVGRQRATLIVDEV